MKMAFFTMLRFDTKHRLKFIKHFQTPQKSHVSQKYSALVSQRDSVLDDTNVHYRQFSLSTDLQNETGF